MSDDFLMNTNGSRSRMPMRRGPSPLRNFLRVVGPALVLAGLGFTLVGIGNFFMAFGTFGRPRYFWCAFIGIPLLGIGAQICWLAYIGSFFRYIAEETAPINKDVINYLARGTEPAVRAVAGAIRDELASASEPYKSCPHCHERNSADAKFCTQCGSDLSAQTCCTHCGAANEPSASYCAQCGHTLAES